MNRVEVAAAGGSLQDRGLRQWWPGRSRRIPLITVAIVATGFVVWVVARLRGTGAPGSTVGIAFGIAAVAALLTVMAYAIRRAMPAVRGLGRTRTYLQLHIWGGLLFLAFLLLHTSFTVPSGTLVTVLWVLSLWVVVSGFAGVWLQRSIPKVLEATSSFEVNLQRIPELVGDLRTRAEQLAAKAGSAVTTYYMRELADGMSAPRAAVGSLLGRSRIVRYREQEFQILRRTLPPQAAPHLDELFQLYGTKLEMDVHFTLQRVLRYWLALHLPVSIVLIGLTLVHIFFALYY